MHFTFYLAYFLLFSCSVAVDVWPSSCPLIKIKEKCEVSKYYSADGSCNNLQVHWWGKSETPFARFQPAKYDDGKGTPRTKATDGGKLPNSRSVSLGVHYPKVTPEDKQIKLSHYGTIGGQFFLFDGTHIEPGETECKCDSKDTECFNIETPSGDKIDGKQKCAIFTRSKTSYPAFNCKPKEREQLNTATHWFDLSQIYGPDKKTNDQLRDIKSGLLKTTSIPGFKNHYLQFSPLGSCKNDKANRLCFRSGDPRVNENMLLTSIFTVWSREHNRLALELKKLNPKWSGETLYQETRRLLIAMYQKIFFEDYLPIVVGKKAIKENGLEPSKGYFMKYDQKLNPQIRNEFSTSASRFGHTLVRAFGSRADASLKTTGNVSFNALLLQPTQAYTDGGLDPLCIGSIVDKSTGYDASLTDPIQNRLFENPDPSAATQRQSLSTLNINRGRDHGTPSYNVYRKYCKLKVAQSFDDLKKDMLKYTVDDLKKVYKNVNDIDLFTGLISEKPLKGAIVGPTAACILGKQFKILKHGDRLFFENGQDKKTSFTLAQLKEIKKITMSRILCDNLQLDRIQKNAFLIEDKKTNPIISCTKVPKVNMNLLMKS